MRRQRWFRLVLAVALFVIALLLAAWGLRALATIWGFGYKDSQDGAYIGYAATFFSASCLMLGMSLLALLGRRWRLGALAALLLLSAAFEVIAGTAALGPTGFSMAFAMVQYGVAVFFITSAVGVATWPWKRNRAKGSRTAGRTPED